MKNSLTKLMAAKADNLIDAPVVKSSVLTDFKNFPLVIEPTIAGVDLTEWMSENRDLLKNNLDIHGALLFRGFNINTIDRFKDFVNVFEATPLEYKQRTSPRFEVGKNIYHSTTYPEDQSINMHSENSYSTNYAMRIVFCCIEPATHQGETPIADNRQVLQHLSHSTREQFRSKGVKYVRNISKWLGLSWQEVFQTDDKSVVENECRNSNMDFTWLDEDKLTLSWNNQAIHVHPDTNEEVWFNHSFFFNKYVLSSEVLFSLKSDDELPFNTYFGDGSEIPQELVEEISQAYQKARIEFLWQKGDVLLMDNMLMSHGRNPYKGNRQIVVSMF